MRKNQTIKLSCSLLLAGILLLTAGCEKIGGKYTVEYEVTGNATFVSYFTPDGEQYQAGVSTPWAYSFKTSNENQSISLRAGSGGSTVYVRIYLNGDQVLSDSESGGLTAITGTYKISDFL